MTPFDLSSSLVATDHPTSSSPQRPVRIVDRPCGFGKTTEMISSFDPQKRYLVITPLLSECERIIRAASVEFVQPEVDWNGRGHATKLENLEHHLRRHRNVVTTHAMFDNLVETVRAGMLADYEIVIDEVIAVADSTISVNKRSWKDLYVNPGYVHVDPLDGRVIPTGRWDEDYDDTLDPSIRVAANSGRLFHIADGTLLKVIPGELMQAGRSLTVYTYKAEGSLMFAYLKRLGLNPVHDRGDPAIEAEFKAQARELVTVKPIKALEKYRFSYSAQTGTGSKKLDAAVPKALESLRKSPSLRDVPLENILTTCVKSKWFRDGKSPSVNSSGEEITLFRPGPFAKGSRIAPSGMNKGRAIWLPNTTRGTNDYSHASHLIYLYDQYLNGHIHRWFGGADTISIDDYALTEFIQWVWRSRIRNGKPITLYVASPRMIDIFEGWLDH